MIHSEEGLSYVNPQQVQVVTPTGSVFEGEAIDTESIVAVSIIRAGDSLLDCFTKIAPAAQIGKILIQRDEETRLPVLFYSKLPPLASKTVVLLDPMLATGGSAKAAIQVALDNGAKEENIIMFCVVCSPEGISYLMDAFPALRIVTGEIDAGLNDKVCGCPSFPFCAQLRVANNVPILLPSISSSGLHCSWIGRLWR